MLPRRMRILTALALLLAMGCHRPAPPTDRTTLRRTPLVEVFEACKESVVKFTATRVEVKKPTQPKGKTTRVTHTQWGSGCVLHEAGYILTNAHMLKFDGTRKATTFDGKSYPVRVIAADEAHDLALVKIDAGRPLKPLRLGRSADLMVGEPAITIGNPFGIKFWMASGIISGLGRSTNTEHAHLTDMIVTDASINPGTSGGPLLNVLGEWVGLCTSAKRDAENIGYAIPIDKVRALLPDMVAPEGRYGFVLGMKVATNGPPTVTQVVNDSPAEAAGIRVGDVITRIGKSPLRVGIHFTLALIGRQGGEKLPIKLLRDGKPVDTTVTLGTVAERPSDKVGRLVQGLDYKLYRGRWTRLPDFQKLKPSATGTLPSFGLGPAKGKESHGLAIAGYVDIPADGNYAFYTRSDDGSRLWIGDRLVVDNDGLHTAVQKRGFIALKAGKHPIRVAFFDHGGEEALEVHYEGPGIKKQPIPPKAIFRPAPKRH